MKTTAYLTSVILSLMTVFTGCGGGSGGDGGNTGAYAVWDYLKGSDGNRSVTSREYRDKTKGAVPKNEIPDHWVKGGIPLDYEENSTSQFVVQSDIKSALRSTGEGAGDEIVVYHDKTKVAIDDFTDVGETFSRMMHGVLYGNIGRLMRVRDHYPLVLPDHVDEGEVFFSKSWYDEEWEGNYFESEMKCYVSKRYADYEGLGESLEVYCSYIDNDYRGPHDEGAVGTAGSRLEIAYVLSREYGVVHSHWWEVFFNDYNVSGGDYHGVSEKYRFIGDNYAFSHDFRP